MPSRWWAPVSGADVARRPRSVVVVLEEDAEEGGFYVTGYDRSGRPTTETTWHGARPSAIEWVSREHAPADVGRWAPIPDGVPNPVAYAAKRAAST